MAHTWSWNVRSCAAVWRQSVSRTGRQQWVEFFTTWQIIPCINSYTQSDCTVETHHYDQLFTLQKLIPVEFRRFYHQSLWGHLIEISKDSYGFPVTQRDILAQGSLLIIKQKQKTMKCSAHWVFLGFRRNHGNSTRFMLCTHEIQCSAVHGESRGLSRFPRDMAIKTGRFPWEFLL